MDSIETIVMLVIAIIVAVLIITFLSTFNFLGLSQGITSIISPSRNLNQVDHIDINQFAGVVSNCWSQCAFGAINDKCTSQYVTTYGASNNTILTTASMESLFEKINICSNCSVTIDNTNTSTITLPDLISVECVNGTINLQG